MPFPAHYTDFIVDGFALPLSKVPTVPDLTTMVSTNVTQHDISHNSVKHKRLRLLSEPAPLQSQLARNMTWINSRTDSVK